MGYYGYFFANGRVWLAHVHRRRHGHVQGDGERREGRHGDRFEKRHRREYEWQLVGYGASLGVFTMQLTQKGPVVTGTYLDAEGPASTPSDLPGSINGAGSSCSNQAGAVPRLDLQWSDGSGWTSHHRNDAGVWL